MRVLESKRNKTKYGNAGVHKELYPRLWYKYYGCNMIAALSHEPKRMLRDLWYWGGSVCNSSILL